MKNISIIKFIRLVFIIVSIIMLFVFFTFINVDEQRFEIQKLQRYELMANNLISQLDNKETLQHWYEHYKVYPINDPDNILKLQILNSGKTLYQKELINSRLRIFKLMDKQYIYIQSRGYNIMLEDSQIKEYNPSIAIMLSTFILIVFVVLYFILMKKIEPLKKLHNGITEFSNGDLSVHISNDSKDEIGQISQSFNNAVQNINTLIESRNLFMRNIMHELKTPITKGNFLVEMLNDSSLEEKRSLQKLFSDMNILINSLANIEKTTMSTQQLIKEKVNIQELIDETINLFELDKKDISYDNIDKNIYVNKELFLIVFKNLIQNAIKYTNALPIIIKVKNNSVIFESTGKALKNELEYYLQPFSQEKKNSDGFGLGLYIVNEILQLHSMTLQYEYKNEKNSFIILF